MALGEGGGGGRAGQILAVADGRPGDLGERGGNRNRESTPADGRARPAQSGRACACHLPVDSRALAAWPSERELPLASTAISGVPRRRTPVSRPTRITRARTPKIEAGPLGRHRCTDL